MRIVGIRASLAHSWKRADLSIGGRVRADELVHLPLRPVAKQTTTTSLSGCQLSAHSGYYRLRSAFDTLRISGVSYAFSQLLKLRGHAMGSPLARRSSAMDGPPSLSDNDGNAQHPLRFIWPKVGVQIAPERNPAGASFRPIACRSGRSRTDSGAAIQSLSRGREAKHFPARDDCRAVFRLANDHGRHVTEPVLADLAARNCRWRIARPSFHYSARLRPRLFLRNTRGERPAGTRAFSPDAHSLRELEPGSCGASCFDRQSRPSWPG